MGYKSSDEDVYEGVLMNIGIGDNRRQSFSK